MGFDVIGDIHGQAGMLEALLLLLGYVWRGGVWKPPAGRQAIFVGDLIDRGPEQLKVVRIVRSMIDAGFARSVMGNHEFNAIGYATERADAPGEHLRRHKPANVAQHAAFLAQVGEGSALHGELLQWFRTLPPMLDLGPIRAVHAWWHQPYVDLVSARWPAGQSMSDEFLHAAYNPSAPEWAAMEGLTKGLEIGLPEGHSFFDHGGVERFKVRARWWLHSARTLRDVAIVDPQQVERIPEHPLPPGFAPESCHAGPPVFVGHYWLTGTPALQSPKVACLDYSVAADGPLVAYRWDGEEQLEASRFVALGRGSR